jgi:hypothetical protein
MKSYQKAQTNMSWAVDGWRSGAVTFSRDVEMY